MFSIRETSDWAGLAELFHRNGLEVQSGASAPEGLVSCWKALDAESGRLAGGLALELRAGVFIVGEIAVEEAFRGKDLGASLMATAIAAVRARQGRRLLLVARAPGFFKKLGFVPMAGGEEAVLGDCAACSQRGLDCFPEALCLDLG